MNLKFFDAATPSNKVKASIQVSGNLSFSVEANPFMELDKIKFFSVAVDENIKNTLYLVPTDESNKSAKLYKNGNSYSLKIAHIFDELKIDYKKQSIVYKIEKSEESFEGKTLYVLTKIEGKKRVIEKEKEKEMEKENTSKIDLPISGGN